MATLLTDRPLSAPRGESGFFSALAPRGKAVLLGLAAVAVCALFAFPVFWLILTSLRPGTGVYYVHRGTARLTETRDLRLWNSENSKANRIETMKGPA